MTERDYAIIDYINKLKYVETDILCMKFFNSLHRTQVRLTQLYNLKMVKRYRYDTRKNYIYTPTDIKMDGDLEKLSLISRLGSYYESLSYNILKVYYKLKLEDDFKCNGMFILQKETDIPRIILTECEFSSTAILNTLINYENFYKLKKYVTHFPQGMPEVNFITNAVLPKTILPNVQVFPVNFYR